MLLYRFYFTTPDSGLTGIPARYECADDAEALVKAAELAQFAPRAASGVEVWELSRLVGRVPIAPCRPH